jgi:RNA polymerase sigma-70 factor (ECF subfamily)
MSSRTVVTDADSAVVLAAAQSGDRAAQAAIFEAYKTRVARQIFRMTGDASSVDDLVQEVFIAAFAALGRFRGDSQLATWLYTIAANRVRNWWDSQRRRKRREDVAAGRTPAEPAATPEADLEARQQRERFYAALGGLPDKLREAFVARALEGMNLQDASVALGVPISTVSYRTRRAEQLLCEALGIPWREP